MYNILVIDDELEIRELISGILTAEGYQVTTCGTVEDAENCILKNEWDLVISDVMIPHIGGFELVELVKASKSIPVILLTGLDEEILNSTLTDADLVLTKPIGRRQLIESVESVIKKHQQQHPSTI